MTFATRARSALSEFFLMRSAERALRSRGEAQASLVQMHASAADRRIAAARELEGPRNVGAALLLREALCAALRARAASRDASLTRDGLADLDLVAELSGFADEGRPSAFALEPTRDLLASRDPLLFDVLNEAKLEEARANLDRAVSVVRRQVDARAPAQLRLARFIRLGAVAAALLCVIGLVIWKVLSPPNLALGMPVQSSSLHSESRSAEGLVNGKIERTWGVHTGREESPWVAIDLGVARQLGSVRVHNRGDGWFDDCLPLVVELSLDGVHYTEIGRRAKRFEQDSPWRVKANGQAARYVRVRVARASYLALSEVEVFGS
jgi:hypothetical protein